jgi:outer membrane lipoprotein SlyB
MSFLRLLRVAVWSACSLGATAAFAARPYDNARASAGNAPAVEGIDVERVAGLGNGVPLNFSVFGSADAAVTLRIDGARRVLTLRETEPGIYEGTYVIGVSDDIRPDSRVVAVLQRNGVLARAMLEEPLLLEPLALPWDRTAPAAAMAPPVEGWMPPYRSPEVAADKSSRPPAAFVPRAACANCAVVESVQKVPAPPRVGGLGAVAGAIAGAVVGHEAVERHQQRVMALLGALGGALLGRELELRSTASPSYVVVVRMADGQLQSRRYPTEPSFRQGDPVVVSAGGEFVAVP